MKQLVWAGVLVATAASARVSEADCRVWLGAADQTALPVRGSIYVHDEAMRFTDGSDGWPHPGAHWVGAEGSIVKVEKVSEVVVRVDYDAPHAFGAALYADHNSEWEATAVTFDRRWTAPATAPHVIQYWHGVCEHVHDETSSLKIQIDQPAVAFRVRWTHAGTTREWIEVPRTWDHRTSVELGRSTCGSETVDPAELAAGGHLELIAIRADRSERAVTGLPATISTREMPQGGNDRGLVDATKVLVDSTPGTCHPFVFELCGTLLVKYPEPETPPGRTFRVIVVGLFLLGVALAVRFRVRAPSSLP